MNNFYKDFKEMCSQHSNGLVDAYNRGMITLEECICLILDYKRNADIEKAKEEYKKRSLKA